MINCTFISSGCNATYNNFDLQNDILAYPASNQIMLYNVTDVKIQASLSAFTKRVNCIQFLGADKVSATSGDGIFAIFEAGKLTYKNQLTSHSLEQFKAIDKYIIILSIDGIVRVLTDHVLTCELPFGQNVMEALDIIHLEGNSYLVALTGVDSQIHLYELVEGQLRFKCSLKGHQRSINDLKFKKLNNCILLASASKDSYIRLWRIDQQKHPGLKKFSSTNQEFTITLESVLQGHLEEVSSVCWGVENDEANLTLASGSFDFNILIWKKDGDIWVNFQRLGATSGNRNQVFGIKYLNEKLIAYTLNGAIHYWKDFNLQPTITGHFSEVNDLDWSQDGKLLVTCSNDQTTRVWANCGKTWNELSRAQIHGYDMNAVKWMKQDSLEIVSAGDEKVIRLFKTIPLCINYLNYLADCEYTLSIDGKQVNYNGRKFIEYPVNQEGILQPLGLMNKQFDIQDEEEVEVLENENEKVIIEVKNYNIPPNDMILSSRTLWPEVNKLYGHGYEVISLATFGNTIASASKSLTEDASKILIWDRTTFKIVQQLSAHQYSVVQMSFSITGKYLASVSKDRCLALFRKSDQGIYQLDSKSSPASRIVYTCAFSDDETIVLSGSRDKKLRIYKVEGLEKVNEVLFHQAITALDYSKNTLVIGLENGEIIVGAFGDNFTFVEKEKVKSIWQHNQYVRRILINRQRNDGKLEFATCGDDFSVRIFEL